MTGLFSKLYPSTEGSIKEDIFYYVYGYLHSTDYRSAFTDDLKLSLPRIGFVDDLDDFRRFVEAGRKLADLHLNYESAPPCKEVLINGRTDIESFLGNEPLESHQDEARSCYQEARLQ